jgi:hypothetical protein
MDFKTLHEDWKTLAPGPFTEPEDEAVYKEFLKLKEQGDIHHHHYAKGDNPDDKKKREKDATAKAKDGEAKAKDGEAKPSGEGEAKAKPSGEGGEKKKLDPVGKEDGDIDNDGDQDKSDKYLAKKRKAIGKSIKSQKKTKTEAPIKLSGEKEKVKLHKGGEEQKEEVEDKKKKKKPTITIKREKETADSWRKAGKSLGASDLLMRSLGSAGTAVEAFELGEAVVRGKLRDLSQELASYAKKHRSSVDKLYFEKIAQIAAQGKMPSPQDIDTDTEPRDIVLDMMAKSFPAGIMKNYKGVSPALDHAIRKDPMKQDKSLEQRRNKLGEASTYRDKAKDEKKKKHFAFGGKKKSKHGEDGYVRGEEAEVKEGWKKGKHKITDDKGKIVSTHSSGAKAEREQQKLMQTGDHKKLTVAQVGSKSIWKNEEAGLGEGDDRRQRSERGAVDDKYLAKKRKPRGAVNELTSKLLVRAWQKSKVKADDAIKKRVRGDHSIYKSAGEVIKRSKQGSKFYNAAIDKRMKEKKKVEEESEWAKSKRSDKEMEDKYEKIHQERDKRYKAQRKKQEKKEEVEVNEAINPFFAQSAPGSGKWQGRDDHRGFDDDKPKAKVDMKQVKQAQKDFLSILNDVSISYKDDDFGRIRSYQWDKRNPRILHVPKNKKIMKNVQDFVDRYGQKKRILAGSEEDRLISNMKVVGDLRNEEVEIGEMSKELLNRAASKAEVQGREPNSTGPNYSMKNPEIRKKRRGQAVKFVLKSIAKSKNEEVNTGNNRLGALEKEIDKLHGRTKHMKYLKGKDRDQMRDLSRKRDQLLKSRSIKGQNEEVELDELVAPGKKSASGYILYHKTFSDAMQHAVDHAKTKGATVEPKEIDDKVATGPRKPSNGKTNRYSLSAGRKTVQIQVANLDNKAYELNMYIEEIQLGEEFKSRISNNPVVNKLYLMNQAKAIGKERSGPDKEHKISAWEDLAKKMGFDRRDYEEFGENQGMYESSIPQEKGDMATKTRLKLEKVLGNRKKIIEPKESERAGEWGTDKLSDNYKEATPGQGDVKEGNVIINDRDPYRVFEHLVHYVMGTSIKNIEDYTFYRIEETPHNLRIENKEGALATITLADVQSAYDDQDMAMEEFIEMMLGFGVKELTEKGNSIIGDEGVPAIGKDKTGQGIYTTDPPKTFENVDVYSKYIKSTVDMQKKGFVVN